MKKNETLHLIIVLIIGIFLINILIPFYTGSEKYMIVLSGSMVPLFLPGDIIVTKSIDPNELNVGDVISFQIPNGKPGTTVTHRIIYITEGGVSTGGKIRFFQTKGDANNIEDHFKVPASNIFGKLIFVIPFVGLLLDALRHSKNLFFIVVMLPACLLIFDEIKNVILYTNTNRARKVERERKKTSRRTYYKIIGKRLASIILISGFVFTGIVAFNLGNNGPVVLERENTIDNLGFLPMVYVLTPDNSEQILDIQPWYGVIFKTNDSLIAPQNTHVSQTNEKITAPENMHAQISTVPDIIPVFWITALADINPYLPAVAEVVIYTSFVTFVLLPIWYKKSIKGKHNRKIGFRRRLAQWKRNLHFL